MNPCTTLAPGAPWPYAETTYLPLAKGRRPPRFNSQQANEIRKIIQSGKIRKEVAAMYGVCIDTIDKVCGRKGPYKEAKS